MIEWAVSARPIPGEIVSGDLHVVTITDQRVLIAAIDALGHGAEAASAARIAADVLHRHADEPILDLVHRCHLALQKTRGAAMTMASINGIDGMLTWLGVGNVEGLLFRIGSNGRDAVLLRGGVVGYQLPALKVSSVPLAFGDMLVFATDGVRGDFAREKIKGPASQDLANDLLARFARGTDDSLVLVARWLGTRT